MSDFTGERHDRADRAEAAIERVRAVVAAAAKRRAGCNARIAVLYEQYRSEDGEISEEANQDPVIRYLEGRAGCSAGLEDELTAALDAEGRRS